MMDLGCDDGFSHGKKDLFQLDSCEDESSVLYKEVYQNEVSHTIAMSYDTLGSMQWRIGNPYDDPLQIVKWHNWGLLVY